MYNMHFHLIIYRLSILFLNQLLYSIFQKRKFHFSIQKLIKKKFAGTFLRLFDY